MDVVVVRLHSHGHRFELACHRQKVEEYVRKGRAHPPDLSSRIILQPSIFTNCPRKELATNASLQAAFQTTSFDTIASTILQFGDIVVNEKERQEKKHERKELQENIIRLARGLLINRFTGVPPDEAELREELKSAKEAKCVEHVEPLLQAAFFASLVVRRDRLDCQRIPRKALIRYPVEAEAEWNDFLLDFDGLVLSRRKQLISCDDKDGDETSPKKAASEASTKVVEIVLLYDSALQSNPICGWKSILERKISMTDLPADDEDIKVFSAYEFILPAAETPSDVDLSNRLHALEKLKRDPHEEDDKKSPNKSKKAKRAVDFDSEDDEEGQPKVKPVGVSKYDVMTHKQLQDLCKQLKLSTGGKKQDLLERLESYDETSKPKGK